MIPVSMVYHRRQLLRSAALLSPALLARLGRAASAFWNKEPASSWSAKQMEQLRTSSPWAHKADVQITSGRAASMDHPGSRGSFGGMAGADSGGLSDSGPHRGGGAIEGAGSAASDGGRTLQAIVCWASAKPLIDSGQTLPAPFSGKYAITVAGIPPALLIAAVHAMPEAAAAMSQAGEDHEKAVIQLILSKTTLATKGHDPETAALLVQSPDRAGLIFGFDRAPLPITAEDREAEFAMRLGAVSVSARFEPKQMIYNGELAL